MGMKAMWTGIRFWEEMETPSTEVLGLFEGEATEQAAYDGADGERDHHIDPQQAEHQHQRHRDNNRIHLISLYIVLLSVGGKSASLRKT